MNKELNLTLKVWRQKNAQSPCALRNTSSKSQRTHVLLEMLDDLNVRLEQQGKEPIVFEHDCREGICGSCGFMINGQPHGHRPRTTTCQLHMREFNDGQTIIIEPFRAKPFTIIKDLMVDRSSFDRVIQSGGYISVRTGSAPDAHSVPVRKENADEAFNAAACIDVEHVLHLVPMVLLCYSQGRR